MKAWLMMFIVETFLCIWILESSKFWRWRIRHLTSSKCRKQENVCRVYLRDLCRILQYKRYRPFLPMHCKSRLNTGWCWTCQGTHSHQDIESYMRSVLKNWEIIKVLAALEGTKWMKNYLIIIMVDLSQQLCMLTKAERDWFIYSLSSRVR